MEPEQAFVDANVFLRYFNWDIPRQAARAETLFEQAARGEEGLVTTVRSWPRS